MECSNCGEDIDDDGVYTFEQCVAMTMMATGWSRKRAVREIDAALASGELSFVLMAPGTGTKQ